MRRAEWRALGTSAVLVAAEDDALDGARAAVEAELATIDRACSRFRDDSELVAVNRCAGQPVAVSATLAEALRVALDAARATGGLVDPTVGRSLRLVGYDRTFERLGERPAATLHVRYARAPGAGAVALDDARRIVRTRPGVELDLGATAKGLAADRAARAAHAATGSAVLVGLGGDLAAAGAAPDGGWPVRIQDDATTLADAGPVVTIAGGGLATSSTIVRRWRSASGDVHHLLDPRDGRPVRSPWRTVSVAAASCAHANAASTAAIVLGGAAPAWLEARRLPARLVCRDGAVVAVAGWPEDRDGDAAG
jgi:thiamine biosynthesis lipoprotein